MMKLNQIKSSKIFASKFLSVKWYIYENRMNNLVIDTDVLRKCSNI